MEDETTFIIVLSLYGIFTTALFVSVALFCRLSREQNQERQLLEDE